MPDDSLMACHSRELRGSYVLLIRLSEELNIAVGSLLGIRFSSGFYAYVGSAMGGIKSRLRYHLKKSKRRHWHIDYLLEKAAIIDIYICRTRERSECAIALAMSHQFDSVPDFGSSDCHCRSHLFFDVDEMKIKAGINSAIASLTISPVKENVLQRTGW